MPFPIHDKNTRWPFRQPHSRKHFGKKSRHAAEIIAAALCFSCLLGLSVLSKKASLNSRRGQGSGGNSARNSEKRVALIIGNSAYAVRPLPNTANDAADIGGALDKLGFEVTVKKDLDYKRMIQAIQAFGEQLKTGGVGLFFYAGHGAQVRGENYMIPVDTRIKKEAEIPLEAVSLGWVLAQMEGASNRLNIIILDACRDNPLVGGTRSSQRGLAVVTEVPVGTYISYSTAANKTASDGGARNSPYTESLLKHIRTPGLKVEDVFKRVRNEVRAKTRGEQVPWEYSAIEGDFYFAGLAASPAPPPAKENVEPATHTETIKGVRIEMVRIPAGKFMMGSPDSEAGRQADEGPRHEVTISHSFYMGKYEVTQAQWRAVAMLPKVKIGLKPDPSQFKGENRPVDSVSWEEAVEFCERISRAAGKEYRLPTEAEWEYSCRAGTTGPYAGKIELMAWLKTFHEVGGKQPNGFGLYDMHGGVWEWCLDWYSRTYDGQSPGTNPAGPSTGSHRVNRGGCSFDDDIKMLRSAYRRGLPPDSRYSILGFRVAMTYN